MKNDIETVSLELLCDTQAELRDALKSLGGRQHSGLLDYFLFNTAVHINRAVEGYVFLRKASRLDASRLLIRPAIEAMIRIRAAQKAPSVLYRIAYTELMENRRWARSSAIKAGRDYDAEQEKQWKDFTQKYAARFPKHKLEEKKLPLNEAARTAGLEGYYNSHYRLYCNFTHAALGAMTGSLDETHTEDNEAMAACAYCGLEAVASLGGRAPNLSSLGKRLLSLDKSGSPKGVT